MRYPANVFCAVLLMLSCFSCNTQSNTIRTPEELKESISGKDTIPTPVVPTPAEYSGQGGKLSLLQFDSAINSNSIVLVEFGAAWCGPYKRMAPVVKSLQLNNAGRFMLIKVDVDQNDGIAEHYAVTSIPVFIIFKNGKETWRKIGVAEEKELAAAMF